MRQLTQNLKTGKMEIKEVPFPLINKGQVLIRNHFSLISAGTEGSKVLTARKNYLSKAKEKPEQINQVFDTFKKEGIISTYKKVMNRLDSLSPLGYSTAGTVIDVGGKTTIFKIGDRVACGGDRLANHAEVVSVPGNLIVKIPNQVKFKEATFTTVGAIAMQGVRQADLHLGESCVVIGLGLLGQLTVQMLKASGIKVAGIDINPKMTELAYKSGADIAFESGSDELKQAVLNMTGRYGVDSVIITAATQSIEPVELAGSLCRQKGKVVIVGAVPTGFTRENYYKKELELRMATSYGPGRYNANYEEKGLDYPIGYVRWTENRNMQAFLELVKEKKLNLGLLTTHIFPFVNAPKAYQMILNKEKYFVGILLEYDVEKELLKEVLTDENNKEFDKHSVNIGFIGAGTFAQNSLLPYIRNANLIAVSNHQGHSTRNVADKFGFKIATGNSNAIIENKDINTIFISTRHNLHAEYVKKGIKAGKNIFVEKPLCIIESELTEITKEYKKQQNVRVMVGFNRRFAPHIQKIKKIFQTSYPKAINYRINAGVIPAENWIQNKDIGGGRIIGEVCHFVDLAMYLAGAYPASLSANSIMDAQGLLDTLTINLSFDNSSIANVSYFSNGSKALEKERLEVFSNGVTAIINDFKKLDIYGSKHKKYKLAHQNKGHFEEIRQFIGSIREGAPTPISFKDVYWSTKMSFDIIKSIREGVSISYDKYSFEDKGVH